MKNDLQSSSPAIAHTRNRAGRYHLLRDHLQAVADIAQRNGDPFGGGDLARLAGAWHDLGKFHPEFQDYLYDAERNPDRRRRGPDHKAAGACFATSHEHLQVLAFVIAGHHGGLPDKNDRLRSFLQMHCGSNRVHEALQLAQSEIGLLEPSPHALLPQFLHRPEDADLFIRMLFSCLVDADVIDTRRHHDVDVLSPVIAPTIADLWRRQEHAQDQLAATAPRTNINALRNEIYRNCVHSARLPTGAYRLTVPTGGGKTRAGLAFALRHALEHSLKRVIVAVPYTSITEQTADVYRQIFPGSGVVLEHHSSIDLDQSQERPDRNWTELAAENWDAPLIVTTTVQLLDSLFAYRTSQCRKLHNIAGSVIILDEIQTIPPGLIEPTLDVLRQLIAHYGVTIVLSTATQPALDQRSGFPGLPGIREIVPDAERYFKAFRRVAYQRLKAPLTWKRASERMLEHEQCLAILNTRSDARALFEALDDPDAFHLSTLMCGAHRRSALREIRQRLASGGRCRVVSTQLVEAGVDLDFPLVLRAIGPIDRIVQAAGRCNREGRLDSGRVIVFEPAEGSMPPREYRTGAEIAHAMFQQGDDDLHDPRTHRRYFERLYRSVSLDSRSVQPMRRSLDFPEVAARYRIINEHTFPALVSYGGDDRIETLLGALERGTQDPRLIWRELQASAVNLTTWQLATAERKGIVVQARDGLWRTTPLSVYDDKLGLILDDADAGALVF